jgi:molybdopterin-guanine dinucleotide biosynthesis protein A
MGTDKALLEIEGRPLSLRIAGEIAGVCGAVALVGDPARYGHLGLAVIPDSYHGQGPLAGIEAALAATTADANLIVACDMPALSCDIFESLFAARLESAGDCALPRYADGRVEPLCAVYSRRCHAPIRLALESGIRKITDALLRGSLALSYVEVADRGTFANLNTPAELADYRTAKIHG